MQQLLLDIQPVPSPTLTNFVSGRNAELLSMLSAIASQQDNERFVYVWGGFGCGKSHLLRAMVDAYTQKNLKAVYCCAKNWDEFVDDESIDCIAIDDIDALTLSGQIKLFNIYNQLRDEGHAVLLMSGMAAPIHLDMRQDLVTRLGWGLVYQVFELTEDERIQAMRQHSAGRGFELSEEICRYLLRHGRRDLRSLLMTLDALDRYSLVHQRQITIPLLRELLQVV
ncbi:DnaA regulatory inactivator Hda [Nitrosomonas sp. JL21]|uniref:DnaA regulatory inactivator Hda n=1 Tax=Nitrosomonas sp. JL21 TaxID=153949 RepID=UPI001368A275|nr:DnaA regulatory inactivator Hda [Nitrosomonas sp. JL21]MBL8497418.1 DnaA regulatory inactivator Hda [Nitrosomonas sp.]MCC7090512.1 DnaA regulatory inactivator Hda [Nitrosomonas sp.]MXS78696.1 DnaA regulatory inactivator Hda [Nitrosomonas sp. JL21]